MKSLVNENIFQVSGKAHITMCEFFMSDLLLTLPKFVALSFCFKYRIWI